MITPQDIDNKIFKKQIWGYNIKDVENFLEEILESYKELHKENLVASERISMLSDAVKQYKDMEDFMQKSQEESEKKEFELKEIEQQYEQMKKKIEVYRAKIVSLLNAQLDIIKDYPGLKQDDEKDGK